MKTLKSIVVATGLALSISAIAGGSVHWSYEGETGPEFWGDLSHDFETCKTGLEQSPIDLGEFADEDDDLPTLKHKFNPTPLTVVNNGHTVQVNVDNGSKTVTEFGAQRLLQYHFHSPSENTVDGQSYPLEAHFVHINDDGTLSVVGVFYKEGEENQALAKILHTAPDHEGSASAEGETIDGNDVLGKGRSGRYYRFAGSLTTPPCTEGVRWYVSQKVQQVSAEQIEEFQHLFHGGNARPVQPLNNRTLFTTED